MYCEKIGKTSLITPFLRILDAVNADRGAATNGLTSVMVTDQIVIELCGYRSMLR